MKVLWAGSLALLIACSSNGGSSAAGGASNGGSSASGGASNGGSSAAGGSSGASGSPCKLPGGVTLRPIDGGPNYYCSNGFKYACSSSFNGMSWDDPRFFPIGDDYPFYPSHSTSTFKDLGLNFAHRVTADTDLSLLRNAGIWALPQPGEGKNPGAETIGFHVEEPAGWSSIVSQVNGAGSDLTGRLLQISCTWNQLFYGTYAGTPCGDTSMPYVMSCPISTATGNVHLNVPGDDVYWFAGSGVTGIQYDGGMIYTGKGNATPDQMARGSNYGDMVDTMRSWLTKYPAPVGAPYIETDDGLLTGTGVRRITPPELNWAVWSTIVHGARWILYFGTTSNYGDGNTFGFSQSVLPGQTISMYDQAKATDTLIKDLAPIINAPFALNYASVSPAGYTFPKAHLVWDNGIDIMTKYYTGGGFSNAAGSFGDGFYIFSSVRGSESQTNVKATFTVAGQYTGPVTVVDENRTLQAANGVFSDTFAKATDVHIYRICN